MRIGIVTIWAERGQGILSRTYRDALVDLGHEVFVFARTGFVYGQPIQQSDGEWDVPNLYLYPKYDIPPMALKVWAKTHKLSAILTNEEYDHRLPAAMQEIGVKTIGYVDFIRDDWADPLRSTYDQLWTSTQRTNQLLNRLGLEEITHHTGWGVHPKTPYLGAETPEYDFVHNAGYIGINFRKGTDLVIDAYEKLLLSGVKSSLLIHSQVPIDVYKQMRGLLVCGLDGMTWLHETVPPPGLYHLGKVVVQPSRMEGLGLTIPEAMHQGRAVITTDAPPMNEFVERPSYLVPVEHQSQRSDGLSFPECTANVDVLARAMRWSLHTYSAAGPLNRERAAEIFGWTAFCERIKEGLATIGLA